MRSGRATPEGGPVSVIVLADRLRFEIACRGWSGSDLARESRLSPATISAALAGRPIAASSMGLIAKALAKSPPNEIIDRLLGA
jgi:hypothetical protein